MRNKRRGEEIRNKYLLAKNKEERTAWHYASLRGNLVYRSCGFGVKKH
jgi:hypothetical protein